jgi:N-formylglutamate deformylase
VTLKRECGFIAAMDMPMDLPAPGPTAPGAAALGPGLGGSPEILAMLPPLAPRVPLVFASPHSGRAYPPALLEATRLDQTTLRRSEDGFLETLFAEAPLHGAPLLHALFPRVWCDANREAWELDPAMFEDALPDYVNARSARVAAGLGTVARVVATGEPIYRRRLRFAEAAERVATCWEPFHQALGGLLDDTVAQFGLAVLIDCHSMPSVQAQGGAAIRMPDFILGDAHGTACAPALTRRVEALLAAMGYAVRRNDPYAGGFITRHYGRPRARRHALQIEINRALYMDEARVEPGPGLPALARDMGRLMADLAGTDWPALGL